MRDVIGHRRDDIALFMLVEVSEGKAGVLFKELIPHGLNDSLFQFDAVECIKVLEGIFKEEDDYDDDADVQKCGDGVDILNQISQIAEECLFQVRE